jgi:hypothetical protein
MPQSQQQSAIAGAIDALRSAEILLTSEIRGSTDTLQAIKLTHEYNNLDFQLSALLHAQNAADDTVFAAATTSLKSQSDALQADAKAIETIVEDVALAGKIVADITRALAFIAKL